MPPPGWTAQDEEARKITVSNVKRYGQSMLHPPTAIVFAVSSSLKVDLGTLHSIGLPIHVYPLYENAFRAHRNQSIATNDAESARLYAEFAKVAASNPVAWNYGIPAKMEEEIGTVGKKNRMICFPCKFCPSTFLII